MKLQNLPPYCPSTVCGTFEQIQNLFLLDYPIQKSDKPFEVFRSEGLLSFCTYTKFYIFQICIWFLMRSLNCQSQIIATRKYDNNFQVLPILSRAWEGVRIPSLRKSFNMKQNDYTLMKIFIIPRFDGHVKKKAIFLPFSLHVCKNFWENCFMSVGAHKLPAYL